MSKTIKRRLIKAAVALILVIAVIIAGKLLAGNNRLEHPNEFVAVLDAGQADSILICSGDSAALVDAGCSSDSGKLLSKLYGYGVKKLDALILTHYHDDHTGGAEYILSNMEVDNIILPKYSSKDVRSCADLADILALFPSLDAQIYNAIEGMVINIGETEITVLISNEDAIEQNDRSIVTMVKQADKKFLLTGDATTVTERELIDNGINFDCDVLKVGHHGSETSTGQDFLNIATPKYAAISVGQNNSYGLPDGSIIKRLVAACAEVHRTDELGDIVYSVKNGEIVLEQ